MNYIIELANGTYFAGWNIFGQCKYVKEKRLAYRMYYSVALSTVNKIGQKCTISLMQEGERI